MCTLDKILFSFDRYTTSYGITDSNTGSTPFSIVATTKESNVEEDTVTTEPGTTLKNSSVMTMVIGFGVLFVLVNFTAFLYIYHKRKNMKGQRDKGTLKRRISVKKDDSVKRSKTENHYGELGYKGDSKPDLNDLIKNDKAYDNNSNFGRKSKLSRQNSSSTIDTHLKVREWIQQEIVHRSVNPSAVI